MSLVEKENVVLLETGLAPGTVLREEEGSCIVWLRDGKIPARRVPSGPGAGRPGPCGPLLQGVPLILSVLSRSPEGIGFVTETEFRIESGTCEIRVDALDHCRAEAKPWASRMSASGSVMGSAVVLMGVPRRRA